MGTNRKSVKAKIIVWPLTLAVVASNFSQKKSAFTPEDRIENKKTCSIKTDRKKMTDKMLPPLPKLRPRPGFHMPNLNIFGNSTKNVSTTDVITPPPNLNKKNFRRYQTNILSFIKLV